MSNLSIEVQVTMGVTPELTELVSALLGSLAARQTPPETVADEPTDGVADADGASTAAEEPQPTMAETPKDPTEEDVRTAMHLARQRIEGEGYKEHPESEGYKKYHRVLTGQFKTLAAELGSERPSTLAPESRAAFIKECSLLQVMEDGSIGKPLAF